LFEVLIQAGAMQGREAGEIVINKFLKPELSKN